jgi:hypothetical protein
VHNETLSVAAMRVKDLGLFAVAANGKALP